MTYREVPAPRARDNVARVEFPAGVEATPCETVTRSHTIPGRHGVVRIVVRKELHGDGLVWRVDG